MLDLLTISNYALIDNLEFQPGDGLSILTGDTGAGKSIMLRALSLLAGERADAGMIGDKSRKTVIEAIFERPSKEIVASLKQIDAEWDGGNIIIRREIAPNGRSRAFINDSPVPLSRLSDVANMLFDIHSQNATSQLSDPQFQLNLIDSFSGITAKVREYQAIFSEYVSIRQKINSFHTKRKEFEIQKEISELKLKKLNELNPKRGELEGLEKRYEALSNSAMLQEKISCALNDLNNDEGEGAVALLQNASNSLADIDFSLWQEDMKDFNLRLNQCLIELKDLSESLESFFNHMELDPSELQRMENRIDAYNTLIKEMKVSNEDRLIELRENLSRELSSFSSGADDAREMERKARELALQLKEKSAEISVLRKKSASQLEKKIVEEAVKLGLENINFKIEFKETKIGRNGNDSVEYLASLNRNRPLTAISKSASGGEMARLMLVIKKISAEKLELPTIIFDEIDTGVSGRIADKMGEMMKDMGKCQQIIAITHLPQVASKGKRHFKVYKTDIDDKTISNIKYLDRVEREEELARMLSGKNVNEIALENARILLKDSEN